MLVRLTKAQICREWEAIKYSIQQSLPPIAYGAEDRMSRYLHELLLGTMHCWASYNGENLTAVSITTFTIDGASQVRNLMIYSVYGFKPISVVEWVEALVTVRRFAKAYGCDRVVTYTTLPYLIDMWKKIGGSAAYTFLSIPVEEK